MIGDLSKAQIEHLLQAQVVGRIGCCEGNRAYVVPVAFVYLDGCIYGHSGVGQKVEMMRANPNICFEVDQIDNLSNWRSVIVWGTYEELNGEDRENGLRLLVERLAPLVTGESSHPTPHDGPDVGSTMHVLNRSSRHGVVFRIKLDEMTGRYEKR